MANISLNQTVGNLVIRHSLMIIFQYVYANPLKDFAKNLYYAYPGAYWCFKYWGGGVKQFLQEISHLPESSDTF